MSSTEHLMNWHRVVERAGQLNDQSERQFVMMALNALLFSANRPGRDTQPVDTALFFETMRLLYVRRVELARVLAGENIAWFPDGDAV